MRYFSYNEQGDDDENVVVTMSEDEIRKEYYPYWYEKMCKKFGKEYVDKNYSFEECLIDWQAVNWAWKV
jgi:hypothetical protein